MVVEEITFYSAGHRLAGTLKLPDHSSPPYPAVVQGPGWLGLRDAKLYKPYHQALVGAGIAVLCFDYRGFGDSEGDAAYLDPMDQVADWRNALTYLETRLEIDTARLGAFGSGGTGAGNAVIVAGKDDRIKAVVAQNPLADGRTWLRRMRREYEWLEFLDRLQTDRRQRVLTGRSDLVAPREALMVTTPERASSSIKSDVDGRVPSKVQLASAEAIIEYRPIDIVDRIAPSALMLICTENDAVTPEEHAYQLYERAGMPKRLVVQTGTTHYAAYERYRHLVNPLVVEWFERHLVASDVVVRDDSTAGLVTRLTLPSV